MFFSPVEHGEQAVSCDEIGTPVLLFAVDQAAAAPLAVTMNFLGFNPMAALGPASCRAFRAAAVVADAYQQSTVAGARTNGWRTYLLDPLQR